MRRFIVLYENRHCECVLFSDGEVYIHGTSIVPPEFDSMQKFQEFMLENDIDIALAIKWIDEVEGMLA